MAKDEQKITTREQDHAQWYQDVIREGDVAEPAEVVKGCMVIKPHGYAIWEAMQRDLDRRFKATGHKNAYFPLLIPMSFIKKEAEHVEGFSPELAVVTHAGGKELEEPYVIRPTSETIIGHFFAKWISSYRDLPLLINQWANVMRWELRTRMFLRTSEFLWQEGHTAHATHDEAMAETRQMLDVYADFAEQVMAMPVIKGEKTATERFAGALSTFAIEAYMQNGMALQAGTSHDLGQNFGKAFNVRFQNEQGELDYVWQTSWGVSTRLVGALIMCHSDDSGLVLPPKLAPIQAVVVPIYRKEHEREPVLAACHQVRGELVGAGLTVELDDREGIKPGQKYYHWEARGVPVRVEIGPRDLEKGQVALKQRLSGTDREFVPMSSAAARIGTLLEELQTAMFERAKKNREDNTLRIDSWDDFLDVFPEGSSKFVLAHWCGDAEVEKQIKAETGGVTIRCVPLDDDNEPGECIKTGRPSPRRVLFARAY
ncbi:MAG: proline--tRNA ligase [bacterium]